MNSFEAKEYCEKYFPHGTVIFKKVSELYEIVSYSDAGIHLSYTSQINGIGMKKLITYQEFLNGGWRFSRLESMRRNPKIDFNQNLTSEEIQQSLEKNTEQSIKAIRLAVEKQVDCLRRFDAINQQMAAATAEFITE